MGNYCISITPFETPKKRGKGKDMEHAKEMYIPLTYCIENGSGGIVRIDYELHRSGAQRQPPTKTGSRVGWFR